MKLSGTFAITLLLSVVLAATTFAQDRDDHGEGSYLALGDSVAFGYIIQAGFEYINPENFVSYADYAARMLRLQLVNAACPGETSSSFLSSSAPDLGCRAIRAAFPLHVAYSSTQLDFAISYLKTHPRTRLVTIDIGANDVFILENTCVQTANPLQCIQSGLPSVLGTIGLNVETILGELRATGYKGTIVVANYYSLDFSDPQQNQLSTAVDAVLAGAASDRGAVVADVFTAFKNALPTTLTGDNWTCKAGLLNATPQNQFVCDIHPSQSGHKLIGKSIASTYEATRERDRD
ncbi:MAG TPA: SGNH/GDSL hydrolase family protein [Candidatus Sulfotelmatobacter sp.]|nr:SGNH/GDSL hydrolase family protein [Candidatus Sulfotelmatobacter sp.]